MNSIVDFGLTVLAVVAGGLGIIQFIQGRRQSPPETRIIDRDVRYSAPEPTQTSNDSEYIATRLQGCRCSVSAIALFAAGTALIVLLLDLAHYLVTGH